jgi:predicted nucleotidyltransferase
MAIQPGFPTALHRQAAEQIVEFFGAQPQIDAVLLVNSCARGTATPESDLDLAVLVNPALPAAERAALDQRWREHSGAHPLFQQLQRSSRFAQVHLDLIDGQFVPQVWDDGGGPDGFELEVGNAVAYSVPLWQANDAFSRLQAAWLPYYGESLWHERLAMVLAACHYDLDHVAFYVARSLYFQAFDRLYKAFQEFLQALCIARRTYPIAYNKWIRELIENKLDLPTLYPQLPPLLEIHRLESAEVVQKADTLRKLLETWAAG